MAITKNTLRKEIDRVETLIGAYDIFEYSDKRTSNVILQKLNQELKLLITDATAWIEKYRDNQNAINTFNRLESEHENLTEVNVVVLNLAVRTIDFVNYYIYDKN